MPRNKARLWLAATVIATACVLSSVAASAVRDDFVPISISGSVPAGFYPGQQAKYDLIVDLASSRATPVKVATIVLSKKSRELTLVKNKSTGYHLYRGKPAWTLRKISYHSDETKAKHIRLTFVTNRAVKLKKRLCIDFMIKALGATVPDGAPFCASVIINKKSL